MAKNKHKERTLQTLAQKSAKKSAVKTTDDTLGKEIPSSEEIAKKENEKAAKAEAQAQVDNTKTEETAPAEKPAESEKPAEAAPEDKPADKAPEKETKKETKEEKKARQKAEYEAKKAEKKAAKEAKKEAKKESEKEPEKKVDKNADIEEAVVVEETKTETKAEETKKPVDSKKVETTKTAEIIDPKQTKIRNISAAIHETLKGDRMSADKQVEFLGMIKAEYLDKGADVPAEQRAAYAKIFNEGMAMNCLFLHNQIMKEGEEILGVRLDDKVGPVLVTLLEDCWGVTARALPRGNDGQMRLEFDIPEDVKESIDADVTAVEEVAKEVANSEEKTFPEPDAALPLEEKLKILRAILSQPGTKQTKKEGKDQMTVNIYNGIEWARKAFGLEKDSPSQILAVMFEKLYKNEARPLSLAGASGRVWGITNTYNNLLTAHAILGPNYTFTNYTDEEVANIIKVLYASHLRYIAGKNIAAGKPNAKFTEEEIDKYQTEQGYEQLANVPNTVIDAICNGTKLERKLKYLTDCNINGSLILDTISKQYSNSESIAKDIVKKLAPFYSSNLERIAKYADMSSYSK